MRFGLVGVTHAGVRAALACAIFLGCGRVSVDPGSAEGGAPPEEETGGAGSAQGGTANSGGASQVEPKGGSALGTGGGSSGSAGAASGGATTGGLGTGGLGTGGLGTGGLGTGGLPQSAGGSAGASGASSQPLGKNVWFRRGLLVLGEGAFEKHLAFLLKKDPRTTPRYPSSQLFSDVKDPNDVQNSALVMRAQTAADVLSDQEVLAIFACDAPNACSSESLSRFVQRAWHAQGSAVELAELLKTLANLPAGGELNTLREILRRIVTSPNAYALKQLGQRASSGEYLLDARERANLLAYGAGVLSGDDELFQAAESGALLDPAELHAHALRLLDDAAGQRAMVDVIRDWFRIRNAEDLEALWREPPAGTPSASSMLDETRRFIESLLAKNAPVSELLSADYTFVDSSLATFYGLPFLGTDVARAELGGTPRRGLLHHASWLASTSNQYAPSYPGRALSVLAVLCERPPPPPPGVLVNLPEPEPGLSRREKMEMATASPPCASCHRVLDPIAFSFDHFDRLGRYQETEGGLAIDTSGSIHTFGNRDFTFDSSTTLALQLAADPSLARCYATNVAAAWVGTSPLEPAAVDYALRWDLTARDKGLREAVLAWIDSPYFFTRAD